MLAAFILIQAIALVVLAVRLLPGRTRLPPVAPSLAGKHGSISIVLATLNEAHRVRPCLDGLIRQAAVVGEIIVVDSGSTDGTVDIVGEFAARDPRIRLLDDGALPSGWVGKVWALEHGLRAATGDWILGVDADTIPQQGLAGGALRAARAHRYDAVSFSPRFDIASAQERWLQPALLTTLIYRNGAAGTETDAERVMANGQCFLARRDVLRSAGGYSSARASFCDDVTLARHLARAGRRVGFLDGSRLYDVCAYTSAREAWREWGRSLDLKDASSSVRQWGDVLFLAITQGTPLPTLMVLGLMAAVAGPAAIAAARPLILTASLLLLVRVLLQFALAGSYERRGLPFWLSPAADPLAALRILLSTARRPTQWRGRRYPPLGQPVVASTTGARPVE